MLLSESANGTYYDGQQAGGKPVTLKLLGNELKIRDGDVEFSRALDNADVREPIGRGPWTVSFPDGSSLKTSDARIASELEPFYGSGLIATLEKKWRWALTAIVVSVIAVWGLLTYGLPAVSKAVAFALPENTSETLSAQSLKLLDETLFEPSQLAESERLRVQHLFADIVASDPEYSAYTLVFRSSNIGPNAFAIPGGIVLMTDELVSLAKTDDELVAVLAHEVGHLSERHSLRIVLQNSMGAVTIAALTGDLTNISAVSAAIPTLLLQGKYSRDFEREADQFAFDYLRREERSTTALSEFLLRLEAESGDDPLPDWFSSHPASDSRREENNL